MNTKDNLSKLFSTKDVKDFEKLMKKLTVEEKEELLQVIVRLSRHYSIDFYFG